MTLRVLGGECRGRKLRSPAGHAIRPTTGIVKEHIFAVLQAAVPGARVLDLFAGTGSLGLESLSRGARCVVYVESAPRHVPFLRNNIESLDYVERAEVVHEEVTAFLRSAPGRWEPFDLVLADPPFKWDHLPALCRLVGRPGILADGGTFVLEHALSLPEDVGQPNLTVWRSKAFGGNIVSMFRKANPYADRGLPGDV